MDTENLVKELDEISKRLLSGEYDNAEDEIKRYKEIKNKLDEAGVVVLDALNLDDLIF